MTPDPTPSVYRSLVSAKSRRLRTIGAFLLAVILAMALYGYFALMPSFARTMAANSSLALERSHDSQVRRDTSGAVTPKTNKASQRARQALKVQIIFLYFYWTACTLLVTTLLIVAWLDFRETTRNYVELRRQLWTDAAVRTGRESDPGNISPQG